MRGIVGGLKGGWPEGGGRRKEINCVDKIELTGVLLRSTFFPKKTKSLQTGSMSRGQSGIFPKLIFATNRAAIGRIWTILWGSKAGPRGHILGPFPAPGGPKKTEKNLNLFGTILVFATPSNRRVPSRQRRAPGVRKPHATWPPPSSTFNATHGTKAP